MARRPLVATVVTTAVGALLGALLGALVGRVIAFFGDATVQVSVPMVFCGTLGYFIGGASAAKGSLERFGAKRAGLGAFLAVVVLIVIVGGASLSHQAGAVIFVVGLVAAALGAVVATLVAGPQAAPVTRGGVPKAVAPPVRRSEAEPQSDRVAGGAEAAPQEQIEAEYIAPPAAPVARKVQVVEAEPAPVVVDEDVNWTLPEEPQPPTITPAPRPRRDRPLRKGDA